MAETPFKHIPDLPSSAQRALRRNFESISEKAGSSGFPIVLDDGRFVYSITAGGANPVSGVVGGMGELVIQITDKLAPTTKYVIVNLSWGDDLNVATHRDVNIGAGNDVNLTAKDDVNISTRRGNPGRDVNIAAVHDVNIAADTGNVNIRYLNIPSIPASSLGKVVAKLPIYAYDDRGNRVIAGYLPVYDDITNAPAPHLEPAARLYLRQNTR